MLRSPVRVQFNKPEVKPALDLTKKGEKLLEELSVDLIIGNNKKKDLVKKHK